jgi:hypothetical protein
MKKIALLVASVFIAGSFSINVFAAETATTQTTTVETTTETTTFKEEAGITPDSVLYPIDQLVDTVKETFAGSEEDKVQVITEIAQERLGESEVMIEKGETELANEALAEYNEKITEAVDTLEQIVAENVAAEASGTTNVNEEVKVDEEAEQELAELEEAVKETQEQSLEVLEGIKEEAGEEISQVIDQVIEEQEAKKVAVQNFVAKRHELNAARKSLNVAKVELKKLEKDGNEEAVKTAQEDLTAKQTAYTEAKTVLTTAFTEKQAAVKKGAKATAEEEKSTEAATTETTEAKTEETTTNTEAVTTENTSEAAAVSPQVTGDTKKEEVKSNLEVKKNENKNEGTAPGKSAEAPGKKK